MKTLYDAFMQHLEAAIASEGNAARLISKLGIPKATVHRWISRDSIPSLVSVQPFLDYLGHPLEDGVTPAPELPPAEQAASDEIDKLRGELQYYKMLAMQEEDRRKRAEAYLDKVIEVMQAQTK